jgi:hypothetical protein
VDVDQVVVLDDWLDGVACSPDDAFKKLGAMSDRGSIGSGDNGSNGMGGMDMGAAPDHRPAPAVWGPW